MVYVIQKKFSSGSDPSRMIHTIEQHAKLALVPWINALIYTKVLNDHIYVP
jgi:hypothetical protein